MCTDMTGPVWVLVFGHSGDPYIARASELKHPVGGTDRPTAVRPSLVSPDLPSVGSGLC